MTLVEVLIIAVGLLAAGFVVLFAIVFVRLGDLAKQVDDLFAEQAEIGKSYLDAATTLDILLREHAEVANQVRAWDRILTGPYARAVGELSRIRTHDTTMVQRGRQGRSG